MDVKKIVEIINKEGRQGPKDLKSVEVFEWVRKNINISYDDYKKLLDDNAIHESERASNRNAFFVIEDSGKYQLFKSKEEEIRKYLCYIVRENPNITSSEAIEKFKLIYQDYTIIDLMDQKNLSSSQDIIDQTIRNIMVSNYFKRKNNILFNRSTDKPFKYTLKEKGYVLAQEVEEILKNHKDHDLFTENGIDNFEISKGIGYYTDEELERIFEENKNYNFYDEFDVENQKVGRVPTDPKIKTTRFHKTNYCCEIDSNHKTFPTNSYPNFLLGHHLVPLSTQRNFCTIKLDCIENMVSLCPNCHSQIHYGNREAKKEIFDKIVQIRKKDLERIGFTEAILKVIFETYY